MNATTHKRSKKVFGVVGLGWSGLVWVGLGWHGLVSVGLGWSRLVSVGLGWHWLVSVGLGWSNLVASQKDCLNVAQLMISVLQVNLYSVQLRQFSTII